MQAIRALAALEMAPCHLESEEDLCTSNGNFLFVCSLFIELSHHASRTVDIPASMNPMLTQDLKPFGVPSLGRLYHMPMPVLRPDCT